MDNLILGIKSVILGITATLSAVTSTYFTPPPTPPPAGGPSPAPLALVQKGMVERSGEYSYSGYSLKYTVRVNKNGGPITGEFSGACVGPISGKFSGGEGGNIEGSAQANCKVAIFSYNLKVSYTGKLYLKSGKVDLSWAGQIPYTQNFGNLSINFEPVK